MKSDPFDLKRFVDAQAAVSEQKVKELAAALVTLLLNWKPI